MARYTGPAHRICRREGQSCGKVNCPVERKPYPPGQHGPNHARRRKQSDYAVQLREKQRVKMRYGLLEKQFRSLFEHANRRAGVTGENLLVALESRLDNIVYRMGFAKTRRQARQLVGHRHFEVNGNAVNIPSYNVKKGDEISIRSKSKDLSIVEVALEEARTKRRLPEWLVLDEKNLIGRVARTPIRTDLDASINEQLIVELYSK
ncbi:MAG: 30S ribosomal protein S4 [Gemmatimonadetes bacterium]|jgi:small subunit ribosomal protein S4|nr:30S ribosomal protein S4 [Gemmatimonadota bacterium]